MNWYLLDVRCSPYLEENLSALDKKRPDLTQILRNCASEPLPLEMAKVGESYLCRELHSGFLYYNPSNFADQQKQAYLRMLDIYQRGCQMLCVCGVGLGYVSSQMEESIRGSLDKGLLLIENKPELILSQFALFDCKNLIASEQVFWAVGDDIFATCKTVVDQERLYILPESKLVSWPERALQPHEKAQFQRVPMWFAQYRRSLEGDAVQKRQHFGQKMEETPNFSSGTIWAVATPDAYAHTPLLHSLMEGFTELGWKKRLLEIKDGFSARFKVSEDILESAPDVILVCNGASSGIVSDQVKRPRITWMLDHPRYFCSTETEPSFTTMDIVVYFDRAYAPYFDHLPIKTSRYIPATASVKRKGIVKKEFKVPILFVGSYTPIEAFLKDVGEKQKDEIFAFLEDLLLHPKSHGSERMDAVGLSDHTRKQLRLRADVYINTLHRQFSNEQIALDYFLYSVANSYKRDKIVAALLDLGLVIYGSESWRAFLGKNNASLYRGWMNPENLADAYASAEIVLNIHSLQCPTCLNPRDMDVLASGGCLLTDWVEDIDHGLITPDLDCVVYANTTDLRERAMELLSNKSKREAIRQHGHETYLAKHTPKHRAEEMIKLL
jgi:glycosyltransferase involved in cell wall biosynthesis